MSPRRPARATNGWRKGIRRGAFAPRRMALRAATGARKWRPSVAVFFQQPGVGIRVEQVVEMVGLVALQEEQPALAEGTLLEGLGTAGHRTVYPSSWARRRRVKRGHCTGGTHPCTFR